MRAAAGRLAAAGLIATISMACDGTPSASPSQASSAAPTSVPSVDSSPSPSAAVTVDPGLLAHLPDAVAGAPLVADPVSAANIAADPTLGRSASAIAVALVVVASGAEEDLAVSSVVRLRPGVDSENFFGEWRASYDGAACEPAGGAQGEVRQTIGGFETFVGRCSAGAMTYHVRLPGDILVSITSIGPRDLGALVVAGLR